MVRQKQTISVDMLSCDKGLKVYDEVTHSRLVRSVRQLGMVRPLVVCEKPDGPGFDVVDGRGLLRAAIEAGYSMVDCVVIDAEEKRKAMLILEVGFERDYAAIAQHVAAMPDHAQLIADHSPWNVERIEGFRELSVFDWSQFKDKETQTTFSWDEE